MSDPVLVDAGVSLSDAFHLRPAMKALARKERRIYISTAWPQVFRDISCAGFVRPDESAVRTAAQRRNIERMAWVDSPQNPTVLRGEYTSYRLIVGETLSMAMESALGVRGDAQVEDFRFHPDPKWIPEHAIRKLDPKKHWGIVHPPTLRKEFPNHARSPFPLYIQRIVENTPWIDWISIASLDEDEELIDGKPIGGVKLRFDHGELSIEEIFGLMSMASIVLSGPCFMIPAACAIGTPGFFVFGGYMHPTTVIDPRASKFARWVAPYPFCNCKKHDHGCRKVIGLRKVTQAFGKFIRDFIYPINPKDGRKYFEM
ncbi:MAG: hypothetical protein QXU32_02185 [Nitrososphaerales archaeon]